MSDYKHGEAFALMWYACDQCGHRERIWNSRDGVTPFGTRCPSCGSFSLRHDAWHLDEKAPNHKLRKGQKFWRDGTTEEAVAIMQRRIDARRKQNIFISSEYEQKLLAIARNNQDEWRPGWPTLDIHMEGGKL